MTGVRRSKLRRTRITRPIVVLGSVVSVAVPIALLSIFGVGFDRSLGVSGAVFGIVSLCLSELREREPPTKNIAYLGQEDAVFDTNIIDGIKSVLDGSMPYLLKPVIYTPSAGDPVAWQVEQLNSPQFESADAIVVLPCHDDARIWQVILKLTAKRIKIIVMDFEPPQDLFINQQLPIPTFVSSNFAIGGTQAGEMVASFLEANPRSDALVLIGPPWSRPGTGRSSHLLFTLAQKGHLARTTAFELFSWDPGLIVPPVKDRVKELLADVSKELVIFCGDDRLLTELQRSLSTISRYARRVSFMGYDGARVANGYYLVKGIPHCIGTIDTQPVLQGSATGRALLVDYNDQIDGGLARVLVEPRPVHAAELG